MRLLRVIASMNPAKGGPCQGIRNSIPELEKMGVHNEVVCLDDPAAAYLKDPFIVHAVGPSKGPWCYSPKLIPWLLKNLQRFDAVIVHGLWLYHGYAVREAIEWLKKQQTIERKGKHKIPKLFVMPHGMLDPYFQRASGRKLKAIRNWIYWKFIEQKVVNEANGLFFTCEAELELARKPFRPYNPRKEINIGYGIPEPPPFNAYLHEAFKEKCPKLKGKPYFLFLSRVHEKKGVDILLKAYAALAKNGVNRNVVGSLPFLSNGWYTNEDPEKFELPKLVIAGPGMETTYGQKMQKMVMDDVLLQDAVFFAGMLTGDAKWGAFYGCEAFVLPSHQENFGIAVVEAMACGKPVLISNQVNIWREIHEMNGGIIADDTQQGIVDMLIGWKDMTYIEKVEMGANARKIFENFFAVEPAAHRLRNILASFAEPIM